MQKIWDYNGVTVYLTGASVMGDPCFEGIAIKGTRHFLWQAFPKPKANYSIALDTPTGARYGHESATMNLGLEIAIFVGTVA